MPKGISLKVRRDPGRPSPWYLNVPASLSDTGKRSRLYFATREIAQGAAERLKARRDNFGVSLGKLTASQVVEAADCYEQLAAHPGVNLSEAVRGYIELHKSRQASIPLGELFGKFLDSRASKSAPYLQHLRWARTAFEPLAATLASEVTVRDLETILEAFTPSVRDAFRRYIRAILNFGVRFDYLPSNPAAKLEPCKPLKGETQVFTPIEVGRLLEVALENDPEFLPYRILGLFCGIRPAGELMRLEWRDVSLAERLVTLRAEVTKTRRKRFIELSENAVAWLECLQLQTNSAGLVAPWTPAELRKRHRANWHTAGIKHWIQQGMRHSFCSYWMAAHANDVDKLVILTGHTSREVLWRHYYRAVAGAEAQRFWAIMPPGQEERKILDFHA